MIQRRLVGWVINMAETFYGRDWITGRRGSREDAL